MFVRQPFERRRHLLAAFAAVALVSCATLGWLGWLLLEQDAALETQRRDERLVQAADRALADIQRTISEFQAHIVSAGPVESFPSLLTRVSISADGAVTVRSGAVPFVPVGRLALEGSQATFAPAEALEFARHDLAAAAAMYARLARTDDPVTRARALARLARAERKRGRVTEALRAYSQLADIGTEVDGLPALLVARVGRATIAEGAGDTEALRREAGALLTDLDRGRWPLVRSEYEFYRAQASAWLGTAADSDPDGLARGDAVTWLWDNRAMLLSRQSRIQVLPAGPALVAWQPSAGALDAIIAGPAFIATFCPGRVPADLRCAISDSEGRRLAGDASPGRPRTVRMAIAEGFPWVLHVWPGAAPDPSVASPRRRLLLLVFGTVALVLAAGWYFIARAMSRELRVARLQSDFVAAVSHEFRSPLTSMSHVAELLAGERLASDADRRRSYDVLLRETDRLRRLVEDLLDAGRFDAGAAALRAANGSVTGLVRATVAEFQRGLPGGYSLELSVPPHEITASVDPEALGRALWNLLDNAVKYSPGGGRLQVTVAGTGAHVSIAVADKGIGIPADEQRRVFDRFVRGSEATRRRIKGTGIGLAMVRDIVRAHGGEVRLASEPGRGSCFTILLPLSRTSSQELAADEAMLPLAQGRR
jgi:two-component system, OmpR family, phosphate regulon sensor histidine kinase PhoR